VSSAVHRDSGRALPAGWYLSEADHRENTAWLVELAELRDAFTEQQAATAELDTALRESLASGTICDAEKRAAVAIVASRDSEIASLRRWYRRPAVVAGLAFAGGILIAGGIAIGASR
jgi:hypothetical protein